MFAADGSYRAPDKADDEVRLAPNLLRVLPSTCITFIVYENAKKYLR
jgi:hypothetical protein